MSFKDYFKNEELTFGEYFNKLKANQPHVELRKALVTAMDNMPEVTFWYKLRNNTFNEEEKLIIAEVVGKPINELFPC